MSPAEAARNRPVNEEGFPDDILGGHFAPVTRIGAVQRVVAHRVVVVRADLGLSARAKVLQLRVATVMVLVEMKRFRAARGVRKRINIRKMRIGCGQRLAVDHEMADWDGAVTRHARHVVVFLNGKSFTAEADEAFDVKLVLCGDARTSGREDDDVAALRFAEVIRQAVNEQMIAGLRLEAHDLFTLMIAIADLQPCARAEFLLAKIGGKPQRVRDAADAQCLPEIYQLDPDGIFDCIKSSVALGLDVEVTDSFEPLADPCEAGRDLYIWTVQ